MINCLIILAFTSVLLFAHETFAYDNEISEHKILEGSWFTNPYFKLSLPTKEAGISFVYIVLS